MYTTWTTGMPQRMSFLGLMWWKERTKGKSTFFCKWFNFKNFMRINIRRCSIHREKAHSNNTTVLTKIMNMDTCVSGTSNQLLIIIIKPIDSSCKPFCTHILFVLTLACDMAV